MTLSPQVFCAACGAANDTQATRCFACELALPVSTHTNRPTVQTFLRQRYRLLNQLGQGGMSSVYKAQDTELGDRIVAIKELSQKGLNQHEANDATSAFKQEALLLAGLMHPNLPRIYDHFPEAGRWYLVMDFIEGETLENYLIGRGGQLPLEEALEIGMQLCSVLDYLHTRTTPIIFRDLKPLNVMLTPTQQLYLIDFGIARFFKPGQAKDTMAFGSPGYASPEQYGKAQTSSSADIYSLGAMLHQMLTGNDPSLKPFFFAPLMGGPAALQELLTEMLHLDSSKRLNSARAVRQQLQQITGIQKSSGSSALPALNPASALTYPAIIQTAPAQQNAYQVFAAQLSQPQPPAAATTPPITIGRKLCGYSGHIGVVTSLAWSSDGTQLASTGSDNTIQIWNGTNGQMLHLYHDLKRRWKANYINSVAWSPDGKQFASANENGTVQVWDSTNTQHILSYEEHKTQASSAVWSPDGRYIASAGDMQVRVWRAATGQTLTFYGEPAGPIQSLAWSPVDDYVVLGSLEGTVTVLALKGLNGTPVSQIRYTEHTAGVQQVVWSPDGAHIAIACTNGTVQIWEAQTGMQQLIYRGHSDRVRTLSWSPDSSRIVSAAGDSTIRIWDTHNGATIFIYPGYSTNTFAIAWSPDGSRIASAAHSYVRVWQAL